LTSRVTIDWLLKDYARRCLLTKEGVKEKFTQGNTHLTQMFDASKRVCHM